MSFDQVEYVCSPEVAQCLERLYQEAPMVIDTMPAWKDMCKRSNEGSITKEEASQIKAEIEAINNEQHKRLSMSPEELVKQLNRMLHGEMDDHDKVVMEYSQQVKKRYAHDKDLTQWVSLNTLAYYKSIQAAE